MDPNVYQEALSESEKALRERFISEFMKDFDPFFAALRTGFQPTYATEWGKRLYQCSYVQGRIADLMRKPDENPDEALAKKRALLENVYLEAMQRGPYASRVAAGRAYAALHGWEKPDPSVNAEAAIAEALKQFATKAPV